MIDMKGLIRLVNDSCNYCVLISNRNSNQQKDVISHIVSLVSNNDNTMLLIK